jgi:predicted negative regulator of RcsB-dependent stress response
VPSTVTESGNNDARIEFPEFAVDRHTRKNLKSDKFAQEVTHTFEFVSEHRNTVVRYGSIAVAVILVGVAIFFYLRHQEGAREEALAQALRIDLANIGAPNPNLPGALVFPTQDDKDKARQKAFSEIAAKYHGTQEGAIAEFSLASDAADKGNLADAEKRFRDAMDSAPKLYAALARMALAQVYQAEGKNGEAEKLLKEAVANPTATVSKEEAVIQLALLQAKNDPCAARKVLEPMRADRTAISRAAVQALGDIHADNCPNK